MEKNLGFGGVSVLDQVCINDGEDIIAETVQLTLDFTFVGPDEDKVFL